MIIIKRLFAISSLTGLIIINSSCAGYRLGSNKPGPLSHLQSVAVPLFKNETLEPRFQALVTNTIIKELQRHGAYRIATLADADAILHGTILRVSRKQLRSSRTNVLQTREIEISLDIKFSLEDNGTGESLDKGNLTGKTSAYLDSNFQLTERQALQLAAKDVAKTLSNRLSEGF